MCTTVHNFIKIPLNTHSVIICQLFLSLNSWMLFNVLRFGSPDLWLIYWIYFQRPICNCENFFKYRYKFVYITNYYVCLNMPFNHIMQYTVWHTCWSIYTLYKKWSVIAVALFLVLSRIVNYNIKAIEALMIGLSFDANSSSTILYRMSKNVR